VQGAARACQVLVEIAAPSPSLSSSPLLAAVLAALSHSARSALSILSALSVAACPGRSDLVLLSLDPETLRLLEVVVTLGALVVLAPDQPAVRRGLEPFVFPLFVLPASFVFVGALVLNQPLRPDFPAATAWRCRLRAARWMRRP
jgi:hypothetical protein